MSLVCLCTLLEKKSAAFEEPMWWWSLFQNLLNVMCLSQKQTSAEVMDVLLTNPRQIVRNACVGSFERLAMHGMAAAERRSYEGEIGPGGIE